MMYNAQLCSCVVTNGLCTEKKYTMIEEENEPLTPAEM